MATLDDRMARYSRDRLGGHHPCPRLAEGGKGWIGYWTHPDEPQDQPTSIVEIDSEATVLSMCGRTLTGACAADLDFYKEGPAAEFARLTDQLAELGVPVGTRDYDALYEPDLAVDPGERFDAQRRRVRTPDETLNTPQVQIATIGR
ncbi:hypothetical protein ACFV1F_35905 [Streptomyces sp. NPDC059590]|uniref:hypothetical protein n=1 Tax=Streptomyces sp. NPDC059590 TaxID=3346877 RepID=UPI0036738D47